MIQKKDKKTKDKKPSEPQPAEKLSAAGKSAAEPKAAAPAGRARRAAAATLSGRPTRVLDYRARRRFPEASSPSRQLQLLLRGSMPLLRQKIKNLWYRIGSVFTRLAARMRERTPRHRLIQTAVFLSAGLALAAFAAFHVLYTTATTLSFEGRELGTVASEEEAQAAVRQVEDSISALLGSRYTLEPDKVSYTTGLTFRSALVEEADLEAALNESIRVVEHGYVLYVDGEQIGVTQTREALEEALNIVSANYRNENTVSIDFVEEVEIQESDFPLESFINLSETLELLTSEKDGEVTYVVEKGDCWSVIAQDHNMSNDDLLRLNPGYDIDSLQIGDELLISNAVPYLTVRAVQMEYYEEDIPYEIEYQDDNTMWEGDIKVLSKGEYGKSNTVAQVTYEGLNEVEREIISRDIYLEPVTEIQARGTLERPSWAATGSFRWPASGTITSTYGYRNIFGGTSFHGGLDIANSYGTDIVAADGGIVIYAGWQSSYGYLVQIDHQNGYVTYYAHNSSLLVSVGDKVYKGQHIAEMGSTGRSTGNHCHFEVRYNGERQNPINYLP